MKENRFRNKLIQDLKQFKDRINVINLHGGTFDLIIEGNRPYIVEIKYMRDKPIGPYDEGNRGFILSEAQTEEICQMKFPPVVVAFEETKYYLLSSEWVQEEVKCRLEHGTAILSLKYCEFPNPLTYEKLIEELVRLTT